MIRYYYLKTLNPWTSQWMLMQFPIYPQPLGSVGYGSKTQSIWKNNTIIYNATYTMRNGNMHIYIYWNLLEPMVSSIGNEKHSWQIFPFPISFLMVSISFSLKIDAILWFHSVFWCIFHILSSFQGWKFLKPPNLLQLNPFFLLCSIITAWKSWSHEHHNGCRWNSLSTHKALEVLANCLKHSLFGRTMQLYTMMCTLWGIELCILIFYYNFWSLWFPQLEVRNIVDNFSPFLLHCNGEHCFKIKHGCNSMIS
jgi:hypothetical protein